MKTTTHLIILTFCLLFHVTVKACFPNFHDEDPADQTVNEHENVFFSINTENNDWDFQWQVDKGDGNGFVDITDNQYDGNYSPWLTIFNVSASMNNYKYRCIAYACDYNPSNNIITEPATMTVISATYTKYVSDAKYGKQKLNVSTPPLTDNNVYVLPQKVTGGTSYEVQVSTTSDFSADVQSRTGIVSADWFFTGLTPGATYYARTNVNGGPQGIIIKSFVIESLGSSKLGKTYDITYGWQDGASSPTTSTNVYCRPTAVAGATEYTVEINPDPNFGASTKITRTGTSWNTLSFYYFDGLAHSTIYFVRVKTDNENIWGEIRGFITESVGSQARIGTTKITDPKVSSIANNNTLSYSVYPNPTTSGHFTVQVEGFNATKTVQVMNLYGKLVTTVSLNENQTTVDLSNFSKGMYFIKVSDGITEKVQKVIFK